MVKIGIDYSLTSPAVCVGEEGASYEDCSFYSFSPNKKLIGQHKNVTLVEYPDWNCKSHRYDLLSKWVLDIIESHDVSEAIIEGYAYGAKGRGVVDLGENGGLLRWKFWYNQIPYSEISPQELKKLATGKGNASKEAMYEAFIEDTGHDIVWEYQKNGDKIGNPVSDIVDAWFLWKFG